MGKREACIFSSALNIYDGMRRRAHNHEIPLRLSHVYRFLPIAYYSHHSLNKTVVYASMCPVRGAQLNALVGDLNRSTIVLRTTQIFLFTLKSGSVQNTRPSSLPSTAFLPLSSFRGEDVTKTTTGVHLLGGRILCKQQEVIT